MALVRATTPLTGVASKILGRTTTLFKEPTSVSVNVATCHLSRRSLSTAYSMANIQASFNSSLLTFPTFNRFPSAADTSPKIEAPIRFNGLWENPKDADVARYIATRYDLLVGYDKIQHTPKGSNTQGNSNLFSSLDGMGNAYQVILSIEKRGKLPSCDNRFLSRTQKELGNELQSLSLVLDSEAVRKILQFDGEKKEILKIEADDCSKTTGLLGMEKRLEYSKLLVNYFVLVNERVRK